MYSDIGEQVDVLNATLKQLGNEEQGHEELEAAISKTAGISTTVEVLWRLHDQDLAIRKSMELAQLELVDVRSQIDLSAQNLQKSVGAELARATATLRSADNLYKSADLLMSVYEQVSQANAPADELDIAKARITDLSRTHGTIERILQPNQQSTAVELAKAIKQLSDLTVATKANTATVDISEPILALRQIANTVRKTASDMTRQVVTRFVEVNNRAAQANLVLTSARNLETSIHTFDVALGTLLSDASGDNFSKFRAQFSMVNFYMEEIVQNAKGMNFANDMSSNMTRALASLERDGAKLAEATSERVREYLDAREQLDQVWAQLTKILRVQKQSAGSERQQANSISVTTTAIGIILSITGGIALVLTLQGPISQIAAAMRRIADGALETAILGAERHDEVGDIARALTVFKDNAIAKIRIEQLSADERGANELERRRNEAQKLELDRQIDIAVSALAEGLEQLARVTSRRLLTRHLPAGSTNCAKTSTRP